MPKVAEIKEIDGEIWARILVTTSEGAVSLYTPEEVTELKRIECTIERERCAKIVKAARMGEIDGDLRSIIHRIESGQEMPDPE